MFSYQEIGSSLVSFLMIFEVQQPELFRLVFRALSSKFPEFNLSIAGPRPISTAAAIEWQ